MGSGSKFKTLSREEKAINIALYEQVSELRAHLTNTIREEIRQSKKAETSTESTASKDEGQSRKPQTNPCEELIRRTTLEREVREAGSVR